MSPDGTVKAIMQRYEIEEDSFRFEFVDSVLGGCQSEDYTSKISHFTNEFKIHQASMNSYLSLINKVGIRELNGICSRDETQFVLTLGVLKHNSIALMDFSLQVLP